MARSAPARLPGLAFLRPGQIFDPVGRALDVVGDRWSLVLIAQLLRGPRGFQELRALTGIAPRVLSARLRQLVERGFVAPGNDGARGGYAITDHGRSLEPIIKALGRWWILHGVGDLTVEPERFNETSPLSVLDALPFMVRGEDTRDVDITFEIRLTGEGGGVWAVRVHDGGCTVTPGFAEHAEVRYTADARVWCAVALGLLDAREAIARGQFVKDGGREAMDRYFHQVGHPEPSRSARRRPARSQRRRTT